ncbi:fimbria/pilus chaperone family protein [Pseudomonas sp. MDT1-16]
MRILDKFALCFFSALTLTTFSHVSQAAGMVPETSVVLINVADGEGTINVTNTDSQAALLYTSLENLPEDQESLVVATPPVARVEAGEKQLVRFIVQSEKPITTQRLKRVNFEGIPQKDPNAPAKIGVTVRQNLPVLITPADLPLKPDPWTLLQWSIKGQTLTVKNDSRYVVRLNQQVSVMPAKINLALPRTYILPGQTHHFELPAGTRLSADATVRIYPASTYGFAVKPFDAPLNK